MVTQHPGRKECFALLAANGTPPHVIRHCTAVADVALKLAGALNQVGYQLDPALIQAAALLHDVARVEEQHAKIGAKIAEEQGYLQEAEIIAVHMSYNTDIAQQNWKEVDILCLADRMVKEDQYVGLAVRMQYVLDKFRDKPKIYEELTLRIKNNKKLVQQIEELIGMSMDALMALPIQHYPQD